MQGSVYSRTILFLLQAEQLALLGKILLDAGLGFYSANWIERVDFPFAKRLVYEPGLDFELHHDLPEIDRRVPGGKFKRPEQLGENFALRATIAREGWNLLVLGAASARF